MGGIVSLVKHANIKKYHETKQKAEAKQREEEEAKQLARRAALDAQKRETEANARAQKRGTEARKAEDEAQKRAAQVQKDLQQANFFLERLGIQPEVWPTKEEFQLAKNRIQYDPEKLHFGVCGSSASGKSSLVNAFRGLKNKNPLATPTGVVETIMAITRYPDLRSELPYKHFVWFDCPGIGTLEIPGWQYLTNKACLYLTSSCWYTIR